MLSTPSCMSCRVSLTKSALKFARFYILCHREVPKNVYLKALMYMSGRAV